MKHLVLSNIGLTGALKDQNKQLLAKLGTDEKPQKKR
jgi:hypothetical protein